MNISRKELAKAVLVQIMTGNDSDVLKIAQALTGVIGGGCRLQNGQLEMDMPEGTLELFLGRQSADVVGLMGEPSSRFSRLDGADKRVELKVTTPEHRDLVSSVIVENQGNFLNFIIRNNHPGSNVILNPLDPVDSIDSIPLSERDLVAEAEHEPAKLTA